MPPEQKHLLGDVLVDQGMITFLQLTEALTRQKIVKQRIGRILVESNVIAEADLAAALARQAAYNRDDDAAIVATPASKPFLLNLSFLSSKPSKWALFLVTFFTASVIAAIILTDTKFIEATAIQQPAATAALNNDPVAETAAVPSIKVLSEAETVSIENRAPVAPIITLEDSLNSKPAVLPQLDSATSNLSRFPSNSATIGRVKIKESTLQKQIILSSPKSFKSRVTREYLDDRWVHYTFKNTSIAALGNELSLEANWLQSSVFEQQGKNVLWRFQLAQPGTAKYHQLATNDEYQLVIVVRNNS